jgi:hypothetical protein
MARPSWELDDLIIDFDEFVFAVLALGVNEWLFLPRNGGY